MNNAGAGVLDRVALIEGRPQSPRMLYHTALRFENRAGKARYMADKYRSVLSGRVLDVGCDQRYLRDLIAAPDKYVGVDLAPPADVCLNLDRDDLPFDDRSFDTVVCTDVLEHLERIHAVFDSLCRIARGHVIISLPAPLSSLLGDVWRGSDGWKKFYGLPVDPPADRHRWFFGFEDAKRFVIERGARQSWRPEQIDIDWDGCGRWLGQDGLEKLDAPNLRKGAMWCVMERLP